MDKFIGLTEDQARKLAEETGLRVRVILREGAYSVGTQDYDLKRVNLAIKNGIVTGAKLG